MNEITAITPQAKDKTRCNVYIDGRFFCGLTLETVMKNRLKAGVQITAERLAEIQLESEKNTAFDKALTHLSASRKTEKQIRAFLTKKGYLPVVCDYAVEKLRDYGFIDDSEYAEAYIENVAKRKGSRLIRMELKGKGLSDEAIDGALRDLDEEQELASAKNVLEKYLRGKAWSCETYQKGYRYLLGKGFDGDTVKQALSAFGGTEDDDA